MNIVPSGIFKVDCLKALPYIEDSSIDLVVTSPPYNIGIDYDGYDDNRDDYIDFLSRFVNGYMKKLKKHGSMFINLGYRKQQERGNVPIILDLWPYISGSVYLVQHIVWHYGAGMTYKRRYNCRKEDWLWLARNKNYRFFPDNVRDPSLTKYKNDKRNNPKGKLPGNVWYYDHVKGNYREKVDYPNQFPTRMIERIIKGCTEENDLVVDPFMGSGSVAEVCISERRKWIGFDVSSRAIDVTQNRIRETYGQTH